MTENKKAALDKLSKLDEAILIRVAELCDNPKAVDYFKSPIKFLMVKSFLAK